FQIMTQNKGFLVMWDWFSDAFQYDLGAVKVRWEREEEWGADELRRVDELGLQLLVNDPWIQIMDAVGPDMMGMWDVAYRVGRLKTNRPVIEPVRPTDLRWSPEARSLDEANFIAQRKIVTADHLRRQSRDGPYDPMAVEKALREGAGSGVVWTALDLELNDQIDARREDEDEARRLYELYECYVKLDIDGDGLLEDAIVSVVGEEVLRVEENPWGRAPIFTLSPVRDPYRVMADLSFAEIVGEIQSLKVALMRQLIINTANVNNLRLLVDHTSVNLTDLEENAQHIRVTGDPRSVAVPFPQGAIAPWTMSLFEHLEGTLEQWTGRTRYNQGMDSSSLNKTATGISLLQQASNQRIDHIVRSFAETGVGELMRFLVELDQRYIDQPQVIRLQNAPLEISPDDLRGEFDIDVNTDAGVGRRQQTIQNMQTFLSMIAPFGMQIGAVTPGEWARAAQKLLEENGVRDPESYVLDPDVVKQQFFMQMAQAMMMGAMGVDGQGAGASEAGGVARPPVEGGARGPA
ncbi:MAG: hypothetical protein IJR14_02025, partial [Synergistaceae bacterium]|nr:hypothetical protein [Synergistaceae bacterium]